MSAKFKHTIEMPFNTCEACEQKFVIIAVQEVHDDWSEEDFRGFECWLFQTYKFCPYCGEAVQEKQRNESV